MNVHSLKYSPLFLFSILVAGCATARVDERASTVPEGQGMTFTRITDSTERVYGPYDIWLYKEDKLASTYRKWFDVSNDGLHVAYALQHRTPGIAKVCIENLSGDKSTSLRIYRGSVSDISFLPDGKSVTIYDAYGDIKLIGVDTGSAIERLVTRTGPLPTESPGMLSGLEFSRDGNSMLFHKQQNTAGAYTIWKHDMRTHRSAEIATGASPSYFPDGRRVLFVRADPVSLRAQLWIVYPEFRHEVLLASSSEWGFLQPAVSPDGKRIAFVSGTRNKDMPLNFDIGVMNADGSHTRWVTFHPGNDLCPRWSSDSKSIYFLSERETGKGRWGIWRVDLRD
jgi:Tol biopolymer transport system component